MRGGDDGGSVTVGSGGGSVRGGAGGDLGSAGGDWEVVKPAGRLVTAELPEDLEMVVLCGSS